MRKLWSVFTRKVTPWFELPVERHTSDQPASWVTHHYFALLMKQTQAMMLAYEETPTTTTPHTLLTHTFACRDRHAAVIKMRGELRGSWSDWNNDALTTPIRLSYPLRYQTFEWSSLVCWLQTWSELVVCCGGGFMKWFITSTFCSHISPAYLNKLSMTSLLWPSIPSILKQNTALRNPVSRV